MAEIDTDARPAAVWPIISDINMPARFSSEFLGAEWAEERVLNRRRQTLKENMQATVDGVKALVDGDANAAD